MKKTKIFSNSLYSTYYIYYKQFRATGQNKMPLRYVHALSIKSTKPVEHKTTCLVFDNQR